MHLAQWLVPLFGPTLIAASSDTNYFTSPVSNTAVRPVFTLGDQLQISWVTELGTFNVTFWQQSQVQESAASQGNIYSKIHASDQVTNFTWTVQLLGFDISYSNEFFLWVNPDGPDGFVSTYFNITEPTTTTTSTATAAIATSINTSNLATPVSSAASLATDTVALSSASSASSVGLTTTSKIALGVGVGVGVPIICALGVLICLRSRQGPNDKDNKGKPVHGLNISAPMIGPSSGIVAPRSGTVFQQPPSQPCAPKDMDAKELPDYQRHTSHRFELPNSPYQ
ncbi:hypothetical protein N7504_001225 [Penicillium tannophilum]|nr:hypothetical protein N7504_001225 [Penicillium tannophilum]